MIIDFNLVSDETLDFWLSQPETLARIQKAIDDFHFSRLPLVSVGPSGIGGEYQREFTPKASTILKAASNVRHEDARRSRR